MARKTVILGQDKMSYSQAIKKITGWSQKKFETEKRLMRYRVAKFNQLTGSKLSAIEELFYRVRFEDRQAYYKSKGKPVNDYNPLQTLLKNLKTGNVKQNQIIKYRDAEGVMQYTTIETYTKNYIIGRYEKLGQAFADAQQIIDDLKANKISTADANKKLAAFADDMRVLKQEDPSKWIEMHQEFVGSEKDEDEEE